VLIWLHARTHDAARAASVLVTCDKPHSCVTHSRARHDTFVIAKKRIHECDVTHLWAWQDASVGVKWYSHRCDMAHSGVCHKVFMNLTWLVLSVTWHIHEHDMTWLIHMCIQDAASAANAMVAMTKSGGRYLCIYVYVNMPYHTAYSRSVVYVHSDDEREFIQVPAKKKPQHLLLVHSTCPFVLRCVAACFTVLQLFASSTCCFWRPHVPNHRLFIGNVYDQSSKNVSEKLLPCTSGHLYFPKVSCMYVCMNMCIQECVYAGTVRSYVRVCMWVSVCMYVCMYVCVYFFMHAYKCVCTYVCTNVSMNASMFVYMYVCVCMSVYLNLYLFVCLSVFLFVCLSACMHISVYVHAEMKWDILLRTYTHWAFWPFDRFFVCLSFSIQSFWHTWSAQNPRVQNISIIQDSDLWDDREDWGGVGGSDLWGYSIFFFSIRYSVFADILWYVYTCIYLGVA